MNWDDARYLLFASRHGSFLEAGRALKVSHTTVSRRVQALEQTLGVRLLERLPKGLMPTQAGEEMLHGARASEAAFARVERRLLGEDNALSGSLRLTAPYLLFEHLLAPLLSEFGRIYPAIETQWVAAFERFSLTKREADMAVRLTDDPPETAFGRKIGDLTWSLCIGSKHKQRINQTDRLPYLGLDDDRPLPPWLIKRWPRATMAARLNDPTLMMPAIVAGAGIGILPDFLIRAQPALETLCPVPSWRVGLWLLTHRDLTGSARIRALMEFLFEALKRRLFTPPQPNEPQKAVFRKIDRPPS